MIAVLIAVRDFLLAMALAWVGVTLERPSAQTQAHPQAQQQQQASGAPAACSDGHMCSAAERPHFDSLSCDEK
jgi:hypothetical protein